GIFVFVQVYHRHVRALPCEQHGYRPAYARIAAGDDRRQPIQFPAASICRCLELRRKRHVVLVAGFLQMLVRQGWLGMFPRAGLDRRILAGLAFAGFTEVFLILLFLYGALPLRCQAGIAFIALVMSHEFAPRLEYWSYRAQQIAGPASTGCGAASF